MIRSLYSGVAGLKTQQTKMDVIGNNIANVGTYGFKSDRATFKDVYYQTTQTATASTGNVGGTNAKQIGYGNLVGSIDTNTKTSAMSSTGYGLDIAIAGEGFLQVMGADGNIMYTKAGMLDIDAEGNLVDVNGNFVLGVSGSDTTLPPSSNKIMIDLPYLDPQNSSVESTINNVDFTITSSNPTDKANVNFNFVSSNSLPIGQKMAAKISGDSITVTVNAKETFANAAEINAELNKAIKAANGNVEHPAGDFTISMVPENSKFQALDIDGKSHDIELTGAELVSSNFGYIPGEVDINEGLRNLFKVSSVGEGFKGDTRLSKFDPPNSAIGSANAGTFAAATGLTIDISDGSTPSAVVGSATYTTAELASLSGIAAGSISGASYDNTNGTLTVTDGTTPVTVALSLAQLANKAGIGETPESFDLSYDSTNGLTIKVGDYEGTISNDQLRSAGDVLMVNTTAQDTSDSYVLSFPSLATLRNSLVEVMTKANASSGAGTVSMTTSPAGTSATPTLTDLLNADSFTFSFNDAVNMKQSDPSRSLGLGQSSFKLTGGTEGGEQTVANLTSISIDQAGRLIGVHDIYGVMELGRIDLATFANPAGLQKTGNTYFQQSLNSGDPVVVEAGTEGTGSIMASTLEASNVDLSNEFSDMIMTQRGFQASSRVITVSDTMLEELINLKR
ncbi:MAG: flagellar hook-basal body complex protein [Oscillospiraceae bacterium]|nr:flagellar hook-basal body complex protein [Oscillospiraceae bacterium]